MRRFLVLVFACALADSATALRAADKPDALADAQEHLQRGRYEEALETFAPLAKDPKTAARAAIGMAHAHRAVGDHDKAALALDAGLKAVPEDASLWAHLAETRFLQGKLGDAKVAVERAFKLNADEPLARLVEADLLTAAGQYKEASDKYRWFVRYYNSAQPEDAHTLLIIARGALPYARWNRVSQTFDFVINTLCPDALKNDKNCWQAYHLSGALLLEKYNRAESAKEFKAALAINPRAAPVQASLAQSALQEHDLEEAATHVKRALEINPRLPEAVQIRADLELEDNHPDEAIELLLKSDSSPANPRTRGVLGAAYILKDGVPSPETLKQLFDNLDAIERLKLEKPSRFEQLLIDVAKQNPRPGVFLTEVGERLESRRKFDLAEKFYRQAMASMPQLSDPRTSLGMLCMRIGKNDEARTILTEAFKADPYHVRVSNMIKVLKVLDGYETISTAHFEIKVAAEDRILGRYMAEYLEGEYPGLVKQFGYEPPGKTQFEIYSKAKGLSGHQWFSARMVGLPWIQTVGASTGMIVALASPTTLPKKFNWARVLKHEFVHILTLQQTHFNIPHWYTEALAVTNEGYGYPEIWDELLLQRVPAGDLMNLDTINMGFIRPKTPLDWQMAYCQSMLYSRYMTETFGADTTAKMLEAYRSGATTDDALRVVLGIEKPVFEKGYKLYLETLVKTLHAGAEPEPSGALSELEKEHRAAPEDTTKAGRYAFALLKAKNSKEARRLAAQVHLKDKGEPWSALVLATLAVRAEDLAGAIDILKSAYDESSPHTQVQESLAALYLKIDQPANAAKLYEGGLKKRPRNTDLLGGLVTAYKKLGDNPKLKQALEQYAAADFDDADVRKKLTELAFEEQDYAGAVHWGREALYTDVMDPKIHRILARAYEALKQPAKALEEWQTCVELSPDDAALVIEVAQAEAAAGQNAAAVQRLKELIKDDPKNKAAADALEQIEK